jgi:hypothetical protein
LPPEKSHDRVAPEADILVEASVKGGGRGRFPLEVAEEEVRVAKEVVVSVTTREAVAEEEVRVAKEVVVSVTTREAGVEEGGPIGQEGVPRLVAGEIRARVEEAIEGVSP